DAVPPQVLDPKQAWDEATAVLWHFTPGTSVPHTTLVAVFGVPADWPTLVAGQESAIALPFAAGYFPQSVRDLQRLARSVPPTELPTEAGAPIPSDGLDSWVRKVEEGGEVTQIPESSGWHHLGRLYLALAQS